MLNQTPALTDIQSANDPGSMLAMMRLGIKDVHTISIRGKTFYVRVLSGDEQMECRREAMAETKQIGGDEADQRWFLQKKVLARAGQITESMLSPFNEETMSGRKGMTMDEVALAYSEYIRVVEAVNPNLETLDDDRFRLMVEHLKKKVLGSKDLSLIQLWAIAENWLALIQELDKASSPMDSSPGLQPA